MNIEIVTKNVKEDSRVRNFIKEKVEIALEKINAGDSRVTVRIEDESPTSDKFDGLCQIDVALVPVGRIHVSANGSSAFETVLTAIKKMEHAIKHDIDRHRRTSRIRHQQSNRQSDSSLVEKTVDATDAPMMEWKAESTTSEEE